jgi:hypothetical protein
MRAILRSQFNIYGNRHCKLLIGKIMWLESESAERTVMLEPHLFGRGGVEVCEV